MYSSNPLNFKAGLVCLVCSQYRKVMKLRKKDNWNQQMRHELKLHCDGQPVEMHTCTH